MYARVTQFHIVPDKLDSFLAALRDAVPHAHQQHGFRALLVLRADAPASTADVRVMSLWDSIQDLQAGEQNFYFYQALAKVMTSSKGFPLIEGQEVLFADFPSGSTPKRHDTSADETKF
ncbi:MAG TPA: antibiotic biosynthesis monooxygenase [Candidatus Dormibacteraeota bacterium]|nr:antibiotic biosynthesis monooxygenase [Candidatus Dormibacteraeota bacterium]